MKDSKIERQYRKILFDDWKEKLPFRIEGLPLDETEKFWFGVLQHSSFKGLDEYTLTCLIIPISNAVAESVFAGECVQDKAKKRM